MLVEIDKPDRDGYVFAVYPPAASGLPWLAVFIGPSSKVLRAETYFDATEADNRVREMADEFVASFKRESFLVRPSTPGVQ